MTGPGLAAHGYDVVSFFAGSPLYGNDKYAIAHDGGTYRFANEGNLNAFKANPKPYVPEFGGYCAPGATLAKKFDGDPAFWRVIDGKLYFNTNEDIQATWLKDTKTHIAKANDSWMRIKGTAVAAL